MAKTVSLQKIPASALHKRKAELARNIAMPAEFLRGSLVRQYLTCGKKNCRCRRGFKHGPFFYVVQCVGTGKVRKFLLKTVEQRKQARAGVAAHLRLQRRLAELSEINTEILRRGAS